MVNALTESFNDDSQFNVVLGAFYTDGKNNYLGIFDGIQDGGGTSNFGGTDDEDLDIDTYTGQTGSFLIARDLNEDGGNDPSILLWDDIDIAGFTNLSFSGLFGGDGNKQDEDSIKIEVAIDNGAFVDLFTILGDGDTADDDDDDVGTLDGVELSFNMQTIQSAIAGTGSTLDLRLTISSDNSGGQYAFDDFAITGDFAPNGLLTVALDDATLQEFGSSSTTGTVTRVDTDGDVTITLTSSDPGQATVTTTVTIPDGQNSATFTVTAVDDDDNDGSQQVTITATGTDFAPGTATVTILDDETGGTVVVLDEPFDNAGQFDGENQFFADNNDRYTGIFDPNFDEDSPGTNTDDFGADSQDDMEDAVDDDDAYVGTVGNFLLGEEIEEGNNAPVTLNWTGLDIAGLTELSFEGLFGDYRDDQDKIDNILVGKPDEVDFIQVLVQIDGGGFDEILYFTGNDTDNGKDGVFALDTNGDRIGDGLTLSQVLQQVTADIDGTGTTLDLRMVYYTDKNDEGFAADQFRITGTSAPVVPTVTLVLDDATIDEDGGTTTATVTLSEPANGDVVIELASSDDGEATVPATVVIPSGETSATFTITAVDDADANGDVDVTITATPLGEAGAAASSTVTITDDEAVNGALTVALDDATLQEFGSSSTTGTVTRVGTDGEATITLTSSDDGQATVTTTVTIPDGASSATFTVTAVDDDDVDGPQVVTITAAGTGFVPGSADVTILDDEAGGTSPTVTLVLDDATIDEDGGTTTATVTLSEPANGDVVIELASSDDGEATVPATVVIPSGETSATFTITAVDDADANGDVDVTITATPLGEAGAAASSTVTITDDEAVNGALTVALDDATLQEFGSSSTTGTVTRVGTDGEATITLTSSDDGQATVTTTVTIPDGASSATFTVTAVDDDDVDGPQVVTITAAGTGFVPGSADVTILDDEAGGTSPTVTLVLDDATIDEDGGTTTATVTLSEPANGDVVIELASSDDGEATVPATVVIPSGETSATFTITAVDDADANGDVDVTITATPLGEAGAAASSTVTITDDEAVNGALTVALDDATLQEFGSSSTTGTVTRVGTDGEATITLTSSDDGQATVTTTVTIPDGASSATFTVTAVDDDDVDGPQVVTITAAGTGFVPGSADVTILDDEAGGTSPTVTLVLDDATIDEDGGTTTATVTLSEPANGDVVIELASSDDGEATVPATVVIPSGETSATFTITAVDDADANGDVDVTITATPLGEAGAAASSTVTITDDEDGGIVSDFAITAGTIDELGGTTTGTITRTGDTSTELVVTLSDDDADDSEIAVPATVTIAAGATSETFTIMAIDDAIDDGDVDVVITATGGGAAFSSTVTVVDDEDVVTLPDGGAVIDTGTGFDQITGGNGADSIIAGSQDDLVLPGLGNDTADGGSGVDTVSYANLAVGQNSLGVQVNLAAQGAPQNTFGGGNDLLTGFENLVGSPGLDNLIGDSGNNVISGGTGSDVITAGAGDDILYGGNGNDNRGSVDFLDGGAGVDQLFGGDADGTDTGAFDIASYASSTLVGLTIVLAQATANTFQLGAGTSIDVTEDIIDLTTVEGFGGSNNVNTTFDASALNADTSSLYIGGVRTDIIIGGAGTDQLFASLGDDTIFGGDGADLLNGSAGNDVMTGGNGNDLFTFADRDGTDLINDFNIAEDALLFNGVVVNDQSTFVFSNVDLDGDTIADDGRLTYSNGTITSTINFDGVLGTDLETSADIFFA